MQIIGVTLAPKLVRADAKLTAFPPRMSFCGIPSMLPPLCLATLIIILEKSCGCPRQAYKAVQKEIS